MSVDRKTWLTLCLLTLLRNFILAQTLNYPFVTHLRSGRVHSSPLCVSAHVQAFILCRTVYWVSFLRCDCHSAVVTVLVYALIHCDTCTGVMEVRPASFLRRATRCFVHIKAGRPFVRAGDSTWCSWPQVMPMSPLLSP